MKATVARLGAPLAASIAFHALVLAAPGGGDEGRGVERLPAALVVHLESQRDATPRVKSASAVGPRSPSKRYLGSSEVDERAVPLEMAALLYPERAYVNRIRGSVRLRIFISADGRVDKAEVVEAYPKGHFEEAAIDAVQRTSFTAARKNGRAVPSQKLIEVEFDPYGPTPEERP